MSLDFMDPDVLTPEEPLGFAKAIDDRLRPDATCVVPLHERVQDRVDILPVHLADTLLLKEGDEVMKGNLIETPAVDRVALPERRLNELVLLPPIQRHASGHLLGS